MKRFFYMFLLLLACNTSNAQNKPSNKAQDDVNLQTGKTNTFPEIGKPMLYFKLNDVQNFDKQEVSLADFRGKWLILDFWTRYCSVCIKSFPKVDELSKQFQDDVVFMLVGRNDGKYYQGSIEIYEKVQKKFQLDLPFVFAPDLFERFGVSSVPHIIWIDPNGIVRAITTSQDLSAENLTTFLSGGTPYFFHKLNNEEEQKKMEAYDYRKPLLINNNGGKATEFLYRSILTGRNSEVYGSTYPEFFPPIMGDWNSFSAVNIKLKSLYKAAYGDTIRLSLFNLVRIDEANNHGKWWHTPILEVKDSSDFEVNRETGKGIYCYELIVPENKKSKTLYRQKLVQSDLKNYFGYEVSVETRIMPYWKVMATKEALQKLKTKGEKPIYGGGDATKLVLTNQPMIRLISIMAGLYQTEPPFIDETGINGNIDITMQGVLTNFNDFRKVLEENGLKLMKGKKEMKVIVIRDPVKN